MSELQELLDTIDPPLDIRRKGRAWIAVEAYSRWQQLTPEKLEMYHGRLLLDQADRIRLLAALLENLGADVAVRLGDPAVWKQAIADL